MIFFQLCLNFLLRIASWLFHTKLTNLNYNHIYESRVYTRQTFKQLNIFLLYRFRNFLFICRGLLRGYSLHCRLCSGNPWQVHRRNSTIFRRTAPATAARFQQDPRNSVTTSQHINHRGHPIMMSQSCCNNLHSSCC